MELDIVREIFGCQMYAVVYSDIVQDVLKFFGTVALSFAFEHFLFQRFFRSASLVLTEGYSKQRNVSKEGNGYCHAAVSSELTHT